MRVDTNNYQLKELLERKNNLIATKGDDFLANLERKIISNISHDNTFKTKQSKITDTTNVQNFVDNLTQLGASAFLLKFNLEKIQELLDKKREELKSALGLDDKATPPLEGEKRAKALAELEKILEDYAKELLEKLKNKEELSKPQENKSLLSSLLQ